MVGARDRSQFKTTGLLNDKPLREFVRPSATRFDAMHVLFANGLMGAEMKLLLDTMNETVGGYFGDFRQWATEEKWVPKTTCFSEVRERNATHHIKANATDFISDYPLLRRWIMELYGAGASEPHVKSFLALCEIVDVFRYMKMGAPHTTAESLPLLVAAYLPAFIEAYGYQLVRFKHHQLVHLYRQIMEDLMCMDCFVNERTHIKSKASMANNQSKVSLERTGLSRCLNELVRMLESPGWASVLFQPAQSFPELAAQFQAVNVEISRGMRWCGVNISNGDVCFLDWGRSNLVVVVGCLAIDDTFALLARQATSQSKEKHWSKWQIQAEVLYHKLREGDTILRAAFHRYVGPQSIEVLH